MKNTCFKYLKVIPIVALSLLIFNSCERDLSEDAVFATFPTTAEVFTDVPVGLTDEFFESFDPADGANTDGFGVDENEFYDGTASIRIDVPASNNPNGSFIGGIFKDRGEGRNLTSYNALTFWAKGTASGVIEVGFGDDFEGGLYPVTTTLQLTTGWEKYHIPIPDPSFLTQEKGMFFFSAGGFDVFNDGPNGNEVAWTFWLDEIQFEDVAGIGQLRPTIMNGEDVEQDTFIGVTSEISGLQTTFNLPTGDDVTVNAAPSYFELSSSDPSVATINQFGEISVLSQGTTVITGILDGVAAEGSLTLNSLGEFTAAPAPTRPASNVISIFSDVYDNVPVSYYNGFFAPFQTTLGGFVNVGGGESIISYTDLNFVAIGTFNDVPTVDASGMSHLHVDINVQEPLDNGDYIIVRPLNDVGGNEVSGDFRINADQLASQQWVGFDMPLSEFSGLTDRSNIGLLFFVSDATISNVYIDNIYFYNE